MAWPAGLSEKKEQLGNQQESWLSQSDPCVLLRCLVGGIAFWHCLGIFFTVMDFSLNDCWTCKFLSREAILFQFRQCWVSNPRLFLTNVSLMNYAYIQMLSHRTGKMHCHITKWIDKPKVELVISTCTPALESLLHHDHQRLFFVLYFLALCKFFTEVHSLWLDCQTMGSSQEITEILQNNT